MAAARFLLDTNICIYVRRRHPPAVLARFRELGSGEAAISVVTYGELLYGVEKSPMRTRAAQILDEFAAMIDVLALPIGAAAAYATIRADLEAKGEIISTNDLWIAAHAKAGQLTLVTNNEREFRRVGGLKVENWISE